MKKVLEMVFKKNDGKTSKLTVANVREDITPGQVKTAMETLIDENVFLMAGGELSEIHAAKIITTEEEVLELV